MLLNLLVFKADHTEMVQMQHVCHERNTQQILDNIAVVYFFVTMVSFLMQTHSTSIVFCWESGMKCNEIKTITPSVPLDFL